MVVILEKHNQQYRRHGFTLRASEIGIGFLGKWRALCFYSCVQQRRDKRVTIRGIHGVDSNHWMVGSELERPPRLTGSNIVSPGQGADPYNDSKACTPPVG